MVMRSLMIVMMMMTTTASMTHAHLTIWGTTSNPVVERLEATATTISWCIWSPATDLSFKWNRNSNLVPPIAPQL